jgi:hypothetical protein
MFGERVEDDDSAQPPPPLTAQQEQRAWRQMMTVYVFAHAWDYVVPAGLAVVCHRRARRRTLSGGWAWAAAAAVAVGGGLQRVNLGWSPGDRPAMLSLGYGRWPEPSVVAVVLGAAALAAWVMRRSTKSSAPQTVR